MVGGVESHTAIVARAIGVPAVGGLAGLVTRAEDGFEALDAIRSGQFQIVISDWEMPGLVDSLRRLKETQENLADGFVPFALLSCQGRLRLYRAGSEA